MTCSSAAWTSTPGSSTDTNKSKRNALGAFLFRVQERRVGHNVGTANGKTGFGAFFGEETVDKQAKRDIMNQELNSLAWIGTSTSPPPGKRAAGWCEAERGGAENHPGASC